MQEGKEAELLEGLYPRKFYLELLQRPSVTSSSYVRNNFQKCKSNSCSSLIKNSSERSHFMEFMVFCDLSFNHQMYSFHEACRQLTDTLPQPLSLPFIHIGPMCSSGIFL